MWYRIYLITFISFLFIISSIRVDGDTTTDSTDSAELSTTDITDSAELDSTINSATASINLTATSTFRSVQTTNVLVTSYTALGLNTSVAANTTVTTTTKPSSATQQPTINIFAFIALVSFMF